MSIELKAVSFTYDTDSSYASKALNHINLKIEHGEFVGIIGKTGCGKSTLIQLMGGLLKPSEGTVLFDNQDINKKKYNKSILRENIGIVFQFPEYQLFETTVERDVAFALKHSKLSDNEIRNRVKDALSAVGFDYAAVKNKSPLSFSGGEKRRIAIAGVLAANPKYFILDEPIAGLDPIGRIEFMKLIKRLNDNGTAIIMISHNTDIIAEYANRVILLSNGTVISDAPAKQVFGDYKLLSENDIALNQVGSIVRQLNQRGFDIPNDTVKYNQLIYEICKRFGGDSQ